MFKKFIPQIVAFLFLAGFVAFAWTEPASPPPTGNVPAPINVGPDAQTKAGDLNVNGFLKTLKDMVVGSVTIKSDGSISPGLNAEKLAGFFAKDVSESGSVVGTVTVSGYSGSGTCGGWGCSNCVCYDSTICSPQGKAFCRGTISQWPAPNITTYTPVCDPGDNLILLSSVAEPVGGYCNFVPVTCARMTYQCSKPPLIFPGCGSGVVEAGEVCDDGNQLNDVGYCSANCSKQNYFFQPQVGGIYISGAAFESGSNANQYCKEKGFTGAAKLNTFNLSASYPYCPNFGGIYCPTLKYWDGSSWQTSNSSTRVDTLQEIWCSP